MLACLLEMNNSHIVNALTAVSELTIFNLEYIFYKIRKYSLPLDINYKILDLKKPCLSWCIRVLGRLFMKHYNISDSSVNQVKEILSRSKERKS